MVDIIVLSLAGNYGELVGGSNEQQQFMFGVKKRKPSSIII